MFILHFKGWHLHFVLLTAILVFGLLVGGSQIYSYYGQQKPLANALTSQTCVEDIKVNESNDSLQVKVTLGPVENLKEAYTEIEKSIFEVYGQQAQLLIEGNSSPDLDKLWQNSQYAVYEAVVRGNFTEMAETIEELAKNAGIDYAIDLDEENIYVQFSKGENYLYQVVPRQSVITEEGGGV
ncbi:MAG: hypothetical protein PWP31_505 [Clostridia bacterium]|nr:hypothetical protein [Clostridia bacterium]